MNFLFIGEKRSKRAVQMGVTWSDKKLAGKQLYDALTTIGINYDECSFINIFERGNISKIKEHSGLRIAMGMKVKKEMEKRGIEHIFIFHPAARGKIRKKE